ncbi:uncharacterized protein LOC143305989 isoform X2 [Osmia lignaria lignaria]|uniref:uncharacterized protein LOC143305989 isoform X2 n=1 Tax=Osmia lignaria lignaria TaxID=1437193 RepID=UPI00402BACEB
MFCPSSVLAHLAKFVVTIGCMRALNNYYGKATTWSVRAFQMQLLHSMVGLLRFGPKGRRRVFNSSFVIFQFCWNRSSIYHISN